MQKHYFCFHKTKQNSTNMKKQLFLVLAFVASFTLQAQWVDDPASNTFIADCADGAAEVYVSTDIATGD